PPPPWAPPTGPGWPWPPWWIWSGPAPSGRGRGRPDRGRHRPARGRGTRLARTQMSDAGEPPMNDESARPGAPAGIDTSVSHVARIWNYWLGGKDNYPVDRQVGDEILRILPEVADLARASRAFLVRAVT